MARTVNGTALKPKNGESRKDQLTRELEESMAQALAYVKGDTSQGNSQSYSIELTPAQAARRLSGLSQAEFSRKLGISPATLRNWEQGRREPTGPAKVLIDLLSRRPELLEVVSERG